MTAVLHIVLIAGLFLAPQQRRVKTPQAAEILNNAARMAEGISDFICTVEAEVRMERVQIPRTTATMYFKKPDNVHFNSSSFAILPREGMALNPAQLRERYDAAMVGPDTVGGRRSFKLQLAAKETKTRLRQMFIWVEPEHWTIIRTEASPYEGRLIVMEFSYEQTPAGFWLPVRLQATLGLTADAPASQPVPSTDMKPELAEFQRAAPRTGTVIIRYSAYKINAGLPDEIFRPAPVK